MPPKSSPKKAASSIKEEEEPLSPFGEAALIAEWRTDLALTANRPRTVAKDMLKTSFFTGEHSEPEFFSGAGVLDSCVRRRFVDFKFEVRSALKSVNPLFVLIFLVGSTQCDLDVDILSQLPSFALPFIYDLLLALTSGAARELVRKFRTTEDGAKAFLSLEDAFAPKNVADLLVATAAISAFVIKINVDPTLEIARLDELIAVRSALSSGAPDDILILADYLGAVSRSGSFFTPFITQQALRDDTTADSPTSFLRRLRKFWASTPQPDDHRRSSPAILAAVTPVPPANLPPPIPDDPRCEFTCQWCGPERGIKDPHVRDPTQTPIRYPGFMHLPHRCPSKPSMRDATAHLRRPFPAQPDAPTAPPRATLPDGTAAAAALQEERMNWINGGESFASLYGLN